MKTAALLSVAALGVGTVFVSPSASPAFPLATATASVPAYQGRTLAQPRAFDATRDVDGLPVSPGMPLIRGVTRPGERAELAVPFDGILGEILVGEGDRVIAGQPVARMDDRVAQASLASARIAAERTGPVLYAEAEMNLAETRLKRLQEAGVATSFEVEEARIRVQQSAANLVSAREDVAQAGTNLDLERARLDMHLVRAPFDGHVVRIFGRAAESSERREPLAILVDPRTLDAELNLPLEAWTDLEVGSWYELLAGTPVGGRVAARLRTAEPYIDAATRTVRCVFEIPNPGESMPSGFTIAVPQTGPVQIPPPAGGMAGGAVPGSDSVPGWDVSPAPSSTVAADPDAAGGGT